MKSSKTIYLLVITIFIGLLSATLAIYQPNLAFGILIASTIIIVLYQLKVRLIYLVIIFLPIMFHVEVILKFNVALSDFLIPLIILEMILNRDRVSEIKKDKSNYRKIVVYGLILLLVLLINLIFSTINPATEILRGLASIFKVCINITYMNIFILYLYNEDKKFEEAFLKIWSYTSSIFSSLCIGGVLLYFKGIDLGLTQGFRATGTFEDPNLTASYLIVSLGIVLVYNKSITKGSFRYNTIAILVALLLTGSRGGVLSLILAGVGVLLILTIYGHIEPVLKVTFIMLIISALFFLGMNYYAFTTLDPFLNRISNIGTDDEGTVYRLFLWQTALVMGLKNPVLGVGLGQFNSNTLQLTGDIVKSIPHNTYLSFFAETGISGLFAFLWFPILLLVRLINLVQKKKSRYFFLLIVLAGLLIDSSSINLENFRGLWIYFAFVTYQLNQYDRVQ